MLEAAALQTEEERFPYPRVLDLFSGTGALGIEALSRGSDWADFVETDAAARATILRNLEKTGFADQAKIYAFRAEQASSTLKPGYDLILADPPYMDPGTFTLLERIGASELLKEGGLLVLEYSRPFEPADQIGVLELDRIREHGTTRIALFRRSRPTT